MNNRFWLFIILLVFLPATVSQAGGGGGGGGDELWFKPEPCPAGSPVSYGPIIKDTERDLKWLKKFQKRLPSMAGSIAANTPGGPAAMAKGVASDVTGLIEDLIDDLEEIGKCG